MAQDGKTHEKRRHPRHDVEFIANLKLGVTISGRGRALNVSRGGLCIDARALFEALKAQKVKELPGTFITVNFPFETLIAEGNIEWTDKDKGTLGIAIIKLSDAAQWEKICKHG